MTLVFKIIFFVFTGFGLLSARAETSKMSSEASVNQSSVSSAKNNEPSSSKVHSVFGQLRIESQQYFSDVPESPNLTRSQFLSGRISATSLSKDPLAFDYVTDVIAGTYFSQSQTHWMINELSASTKLNDSVRVSAGRKKQNWSYLDDYWQMSLWQPKYSIDALRPEAQGLTGVFFDMEREQFQFLAYASPISIPTLGPEIRTDDGAIKSDSRWYRAPSQSFKLGNNVSTLSYKIDSSDTSRLINNPGVGLLTRFGQASVGPWITLAAADKPINDLILTRNIVVNTGSNSSNVTVQPDIARHYLWSSDVGYSFKTVKIVVSYLADQPRVSLPKEEWATQGLKPVSSYSGVVDWSLRSLTKIPLQVQLGYLKVFGGEIEDIEHDGQTADLTLFDQRLKFTNTFSAKLQGSFNKTFGRPLIAKVFYFYDWDQRGTLIGSEFQYQYTQQWMILAGADVMGVSDESYRVNSFLNQYRANDRVYGGLNYVY